MLRFVKTIHFYEPIISFPEPSFLLASRNLFKLANEKSGVEPRKVIAISIQAITVDSFQTGHLFLGHAYPNLFHLVVMDGVHYFPWNEPNSLNQVKELQKGNTDWHDFWTRRSNRQLDVFLRKRVVLGKMISYAMWHEFTAFELLDLAIHMPRLKRFYIFGDQYSNEKDISKIVGKHQQRLLEAWPILKLIVRITLLDKQPKTTETIPSLKIMKLGDITVIDHIVAVVNREASDKPRYIM